MKHIFHKLLRSYWFSSAFFSISQRLSILLFGMGNYMMLVRIFTKETIGDWEIFVAIVSIVEMTRNGLIQNGLIKYYIDSKDINSKSKYFSGSIIINIVYTSIISVLFLTIFLIGYVFSYPGFYMLGKMFSIHIITIFLVIVISQCHFLQRANFDFKGVFISALINQGVFFSITFFYYINEYSIEIIDIVYGQLIGTFSAAIFNIFYTQRYEKMSFIISKYHVKKLLNYGKYTLGTNISAMVFKSVDKLMLYVFSGPATVAIYSAATRLTNLVEHPSSAMADIVYPKAVSRILNEDKGYTKKIYEKSVGALLTFTIPLVLIILLGNDTLISFINGNEYSESSKVLRLTILFGLISPFNRQFGTIMDSVGLPEVNFKLLLNSLIVNIIFNYFLISYFEVYGAAIGTLLSYFYFLFISQKKLFISYNIMISSTFKESINYYIIAFNLLFKRKK